ncbi:MAG: hypothetical protein ACI8QZ_002556 [Chlamydiales bacterium]
MEMLSLWTSSPMYFVILLMDQLPLRLCTALGFLFPSSVIRELREVWSTHLV